MTLYQGPRQIRLGEMRHRITVQQLTETYDAETGQPTRVWTNFATNVPACFQDIFGNENTRGGQIESQNTARFIVRYIAGYKPTMRIYFNGVFHNITDVRQVQGNTRYLELYCRSVNNGEVA